MPGLFSRGTYVDSWSDGAGALQLRCPGCGHWLPTVSKSAVVPEACNGWTDWLDCACFHHQGLPVAGHRLSECRCVARFRVTPSGTNGRYLVQAVDQETMQQREQAREDALVGAVPSRRRRRKK